MSSEESERTTRVIQEFKQPITVELTRGQRGAYGWSIKVNAEDMERALYLIDTIDAELRARYGGAGLQVKEAVGEA
jgi:hypothetical protein